MRELRMHGSVRGAASNGRPYRELIGLQARSGSYGARPPAITVWSAGWGRPISVGEFPAQTLEGLLATRCRSLRMRPRLQAGRCAIGSAAWTKDLWCSRRDTWMT